jgi:hypothetical protein
MRKLSEQQRNEIAVIQHYLSFEDVEAALGTLSPAALAFLREECVRSIERQTRIIAAIVCKAHLAIGSYALTTSSSVIPLTAGI